MSLILPGHPAHHRNPAPYPPAEPGPRAGRPRRVAGSRCSLRVSGPGLLGRAGTAAACAEFPGAVQPLPGDEPVITAGPSGHPSVAPGGWTGWCERGSVQRDGSKPESALSLWSPLAARVSSLPLSSAATLAHPVPRTPLPHALSSTPTHTPASTCNTTTTHNPR